MSQSSYGVPVVPVSQLSVSQMSLSLLSGNLAREIFKFQLEWERIIIKIIVIYYLEKQNYFIVIDRSVDRNYLDSLDKSELK